VSCTKKYTNGKAGKQLKEQTPYSEENDEGLDKVVRKKKERMMFRSN